MMLRKVVGLSVIGLALWACSSSDSSGGSSTPKSCTDDPSSCAAGTVCWLDDLAKGTYSCLPAMKGAGQGTTCQNVVGQPTCDQGLACFPTTTTSSGVCEPFCSATNLQCAPPSGGQCYKLSLQSNPKYSIYVCSAPQPNTDGGTDGAAGGPGTGGAAGMDAGTGGAAGGAGTGGAAGGPGTGGAAGSSDAGTD